MKTLVALFVLCAAMANVCHAQVVAKDQPQLTDALIAGDPCCVIDGRSAADRKKMPLANALVWRPDLEIKPTSAVVVIADQDAEALAIAAAIGSKHPGKTIIAVQGGLIAWKGASTAAAKAVFVPGGTSQSFVIPSNTCEQGTPLQKLLRDKPRESK
jgi:putative intracellular protease/amidase